MGQMRHACPCLSFTLASYPTGEDSSSTIETKEVRSDDRQFKIARGILPKHRLLAMKKKIVVVGAVAIGAVLAVAALLTVYVVAVLNGD